MVLAHSKGRTFGFEASLSDDGDYNSNHVHSLTCGYMQYVEAWVELHQHPADGPRMRVKYPKRQSIIRHLGWRSYVYVCTNESPAFSILIAWRAYKYLKSVMKRQSGVTSLATWRYISVSMSGEEVYML